MKKLILASLLALFWAGAANAQRRATVSGVVADADTRQTLIGAIVELIPASDSTKTAVLVSGAGGAFSTGLSREMHNIRASYFGYDTLRNSVNITTARQSLDTLFLRAGIQIDAVVKEAVAIRQTLEGDTVVYNADAYKVASDADVVDLLKKMPGITVDGNTVQAQGETIQKVLLDGKEYFGNDVGTAINSLPAEAIKNIELFSKMSDNAEFTGIDDGNSYKTLNLITREGMRHMITGRITGRYGVEPPEYDGEGWQNFGSANASVNILKGDSRLTFGGNFSNINAFRSQSGGGQMSYSDMLGKNKTWNVRASYGYNISNGRSESSVERTYYESDDPENPFPYTNYYSTSSSSSRGNTHRFDTDIDFRPTNQNHRLRIRARANVSDSKNGSGNNETYVPYDGSGNIVLDNWNSSTGNNISSNFSAIYSIKLGKPGRTLVFEADGSYGPRKSDSESYNERPDRPTRWQLRPNRNSDYSIGGGVAYTEPLSENSVVSLNYNIGYNYSDDDRKSYLRPYLGDDAQGNALWGDVDWSAPDIYLSEVLNEKRTTHQIGPRFSTTKNGTTIAGGVGYEYTARKLDRVLPEVQNWKADFNNVNYQLMVRSKTSPNSNLRVDVRGRTGNPSLTDLQDIPDISSTSNISKGNPYLKSSFSNSISATYNITNVEKGRSLSFNFGASQTSNSIVRRTLINSEGFLIINSEGAVVDTLDAVGRYSEPININGVWDARFGIGYGLPITLLRSNLDLNASISYSERPSQTGTWRPSMSAPVYTTNYQNSLSTSLGISLDSNVSENIDFSVGYNASYRNVRSTFLTNSNNETLNQSMFARYKFVLPLTFTFSGNINYTYDKSLTREDDKNEFFVVNLSIGKKVFRSKLGEVNLFVNNLFDRNDSFNRSYFNDYYQSMIRATLGRYFGVSFTWNIRNYRGNNAGNAPRGGFEGRGERGVPPEGFNRGGGGGRGEGGGNRVNFGGAVGGGGAVVGGFGGGGGRGF